MTDGGPADDRARNARREAARQKARRLRTEHKRREKRRRILIQGGIGLAIVAALAVTAVVIVSSVRPPAPGPANMASDGILIGKGMKAQRTPAIPASGDPTASAVDPEENTVRIVEYVDYLCPYCGRFERANGRQIGKLVREGAATVEIHPIPFLQAYSNGTKYSLRATNAAACVADRQPDSFWTFNTLLFENQPKENSDGLPDSRLKSLVKDSGAQDLSGIDACIDEGRFTGWARDALDRATAGPIPNSDVPKLEGTPLILVDGKRYKGSLTDPGAFKSFVLQTASETASSASPSPSPTPSPSAKKKKK